MLFPSECGLKPTNQKREDLIELIRLCLTSTYGLHTSRSVIMESLVTANTFMVAFEPETIESSNLEPTCQCRHVEVLSSYGHMDRKH